jgi:hypothetical protein
MSTTMTITNTILLPAAAAAALSAAMTPNGSSSSSPAFVKKAIAPKELIHREPIRASFKVQARTIYTSKKALIKVP